MHTSHHMHGNKIHVTHSRDMIHPVCHLSYPTNLVPGSKEHLQQPTLLSKCSQPFYFGIYYSVIFVVLWGFFCCLWVFF